MSIKPEYFDFLKHFGETVCLKDYRETDNNVIALRHDVDYCIDTALEMAYWEKELGIKSSYFMLHTANYWNDPRLVDKCLQIQKFGHEIGLHTNLITQWYRANEKIEEQLKGLLNLLREGGIELKGSSAHGDQACYKSNFINYWIFKELKPEEPAERENKLNAEGIYEKDITKRIKYPDLHEILNETGKILPLWQVSMSSLGLEYEASHLNFDHYYSDSGGSWKRTDNPLTKNLKKGRHQVLMHPIHWRGPKKIIFFLSTARSGSKWFSSILDTASSCDTKHEFTLNHYRQEEEVVAEKMTGQRLHELLNDNEKIEQALLTTRQLVDESDRDYAEANVYLPMVMDQLKENFPDAKLVHLYRDPKKVVRSILNRGWYDTLSDTSHPIISIGNWEKLTPFEKCCHYVKYTNKQLIDVCSTKVQLEQLTKDADYVEQFLKKLRVPFYPYLAKASFEKIINQNKINDFPEFEQWDIKKKQSYEQICSSIESELGYSHKPLSFYENIRKNIQALLVPINQWLKQNQNKQKIIIINFNNPELLIKKGRCINCNTRKMDASVKIIALSQEEHASFLLSGGSSTWSKLGIKEGWRLESESYYTLNIEYDLPKDVVVTVFCLMYDSQRKLIYKRTLGRLDAAMNIADFSFAPMGKSKFFNITFYLPKQDIHRNFYISKICINKRNH